MDKMEIIQIAEAFIENSADNRIKSESNAPRELVGERIYDAPILDFARPVMMCLLFLKSRK